MDDNERAIICLVEKANRARQEGNLERACFLLDAAMVRYNQRRLFASRAPRKQTPTP